MMIELIKQKISSVKPWPDLESEDKEWYEDARKYLDDEEAERAAKCSTYGIRIGYLLALRELEEEVQSE